VYVPFAQSPARGVVLLVQTAGDPTALARPLGEAVAERFPDTALAGVDSLAGHLWTQGWMFRLFGGLFVVFGASALVLAAAGLYGLMAVTVSGRTHEIGVRLALGADRRTVLQMVIRQGLRWVALGVGLGILPGWWLGTLMRELLAGVSPADPAVYALTTGTLLFTGTLATIVPAWRAASVDPLAALRKH
jgi:putative ABC transport system permease protein